MAIGRLFRGLAENIDQTRKQKIADMGGLEDRMSGPSIPSGFNFLVGGFPNGGGFPNRGGFGKFMTGDLPGPILGPDDFGSYQIPASDPTYSSGFDYARSIAGGMPMSQVIAPGVSYSPEQPMGYTQEQLNTAIGTTPTVSTQEPDDPRFLGTGINGVTIFDEIFDRKRRPPRDLPPGTRSMFGGDPRDLPIPLSSLPRFDQAEMAENIARTMRESGMDFTNLFGMPSVKPPSEDLDTPYRLRPPIGGARPRPTLIPTGVSENNLDVTTVKPPSEESDILYRNGPVVRPGPQPTLRPTEELIAEGFIPPKINDQIFIDDRPIIDERVGTIGGFIPPQEPIAIGGIGNISGPTPDIRDLILPPITSIENIEQDPRIANIPTITPPIVPPMDLPMSLPDILGIPTQTPPIMPPMDIPPMDIPPMDIPPVDFPPIVELPPIRGIGRPNQNRFSIQQLPRGLF